MKTILKIQLVFTALTLLSVLNVNAQQEKYLAAFVYQFTNYINWPSNSGEFVIGVMGSSNVTTYLQQLAKEKKVGSKVFSPGLDKFG